MPDKTTPKIRRLARKAQKQKNMIAPDVTNIKTKSEVESQHFSIGYQFYRDDLCEAESMDSGPLRKAIAYFKQVGTCTTFLEVKNIGLRVEDVVDANAYKRYYNGLRDEDIELKELISGSSARHFFYVDPARKLVQVIAHVNAHTPLGKQVK